MIVIYPPWCKLVNSLKRKNYGIQRLIKTENKSDGMRGEEGDNFIGRISVSKALLRWFLSNITCFLLFQCKMKLLLYLFVFM